MISSLRFRPDTLTAQPTSASPDAQCSRQPNAYASLMRTPASKTPCGQHRYTSRPGARARFPISITVAIPVAAPGLIALAVSPPVTVITVPVPIRGWRRPLLVPFILVSSVPRDRSGVSRLAALVLFRRAAAGGGRLEHGLFERRVLVLGDAVSVLALACSRHRNARPRHVRPCCTPVDTIATALGCLFRALRCGPGSSSSVLLVGLVPHIGVLGLGQLVQTQNAHRHLKNLPSDRAA
jgi:hypothetical protein